MRPTLFPSVPRVYEKIYTTVVARFEHETGARRKLIDWALRVGRRRSALRAGAAAAPARPRAAACDRRPARLLEGEGAARRPPARRERRRSAALTRHRGVLPRDGHPDPRGLRPLRGHDRGDRQPPARVQVRHGRRAAAGRRDRDRRRRRDPDPVADRVRRLLPRSGGDARGTRRRGLRPHRRHRPRRRRRVPRHHRPQEGHHRHGGRQERRAAGPRERAQVARGRLAGASSSAIACPTSQRSSRSTRSSRRATRRRRCSEPVDAVNDGRSRHEQIKRFRILPREFSLERRRGDADAEDPAEDRARALRRRRGRAVRSAET